MQNKLVNFLFQKLMLNVISSTCIQIRFLLDLLIPQSSVQESLIPIEISKLYRLNTRQRCIGATNGNLITCTKRLFHFESILFQMYNEFAAFTHSLKSVTDEQRRRRKDERGEREK